MFISLEEYLESQPKGVSYLFDGYLIIGLPQPAGKAANKQPVYGSLFRLLVLRHEP